jgi:hypothetical protein
MNKFACGYCGTEQILERSGGTISLKSVTDAIAKVQTGTDKTAAELALYRLPYELDSLLSQRWQREDYAKREIMKQMRKVSDSLFMLIVIGSAVVVVIPLFLAIAFKNAIVVLIGFIVSGILLILIAKSIYREMAQKRKYELNRIQEECNKDLATLDFYIREVQSKLERNRMIANS